MVQRVLRGETSSRIPAKTPRDKVDKRIVVALEDMSQIFRARLSPSAFG